MLPTGENILLTGYPGVGKTTLIMKLADALRRRQPVGFYTEEIREGNVRMGFELADFTGRRQTLSHVDIHKQHRVSKYGVDVAGFERFLKRIDLLDPGNELVIIDEIGKMECLSAEFRELVVRILDSQQLLIATIALKGGGLISEIKRRSDVRLIEITTRNRDRLVQQLPDGLP